MPVLRFCLFFRDATQKANRKTGKSAHPPNEDDHGPIIVQRAIPVLEGDTPDILAARVFEAECDAYPEAIRAIRRRATGNCEWTIADWNDRR